MQRGQYACIAEGTPDFQVSGETFIQTRADGLEGTICMHSGADTRLSGFWGDFQTDSGRRIGGENMDKT